LIGGFVIIFGGATVAPVGFCVGYFFCGTGVCGFFYGISFGNSYDEDYY
jgi:hypothetical protein